MKNWLIASVCTLMGCSTVLAPDMEGLTPKIPAYLLRVEPMPAKNLPEKADNADGVRELGAYGKWCEAGWARVRQIDEVQNPPAWDAHKWDSK